MKNIFKTLAIVALGFFATSCVSADVEDVQVASGEGVVNFTVSTPGATSRAIADGKSATQLTCGVYDAQWNYLTKVDGQFDGSSLTTTVSIRLVNKKVYNFVFWAQDPDADCYTLTLDHADGPNVAVTYNGVANDESRDAFFGQLTDLQVNGTMNEKVELTRPFAQVNFGTLDTELAKVAGFDITVPEAKTTVTTRAYNTLYLGNSQHGAVGGAQDVQVTFSDAALPNEDLYLLNDTAHTTPYDWLSMNYILVPESESSLSECTLVVKDNKGQSVEVKYPSAPVKRNWRTNLVGNLLTDQVVIEVEILPIPEGDLTNASGYYVQNGVYHIQNATGLAWLAEQVNGGNSFSGVKIVLGGDIDLSATRATTYTEWTPIGTSDHAFSGSFDGSGYTVRNFQVTALEGHAGLFGYITLGGPIQNLTVENVKIVANHYAGGIVGRGYVDIENCHVNNVDITLSVKNNDWSDKAGGVIGQILEGSSIVKNCTAKNVSINGYRDLGGIAGMAHDNNTVTGCSVENITIVQDLSVDYEAATPTTLGGVVGRQGSNVTYENNTETNVNIGIAANNVTELNAALAANNNATVILSEGTYAVGNGLGNGNAGELTIAGAGIDKTTIDAPANQHGNNQLPGLYGNNKDLVFKNLTFVTTNNGYEGGIGHAKSVTFINCKIVGQFYCHSNAPHTFIDCTIDPLTGYLYTYASNCDFEGCTFTASEGKALQVYAEAPGTFNVNIKNCEFTAAKVAQTWDEKPVTAIDINSANGAKMIVNIENCEATGFGVGEFSGNDLWNIKSGALNGNLATVTVDGKTMTMVGYTKVGEGLFKSNNKYGVLNAEGLALLNSMMVDKSAGKDVAVEILKDIDFTGKTWTPVDSHVDFGMAVNEFNGNGYTISNLTINGQAMFKRFSNAHDVVVKNITFDNASVNHNSINTAIIVGHTYNNLLLDNVDVKNSTIVGGYKVATLIATVYNEGTSTITATLKNCDVTNTTVKALSYDFDTAGLVAFVYGDDNDKVEFENCTISNVKLSAPAGYELHAAICAIYSNDDHVLVNEAEGVTVTNVTFENI